ncbi:hypothetical protein SAY86_016048 [Trapa natans]|uniref:Uncharacterized protein n=1 Tax=Trapa natans TaxID=22666 RepID=A0AAN7L9N9_TRANT|nr:hypothetical protein SAY86_016048 [Trapa natans]
MGGGVIRTVGKVAGIGAAASRSFSGVHPAPLAEQSTRGASVKVASIVSSKNVSASSSDVSTVSVQRPSWEIDDWEFAGGEGDLVISSGEPMPRVVFGPAPTFEEARAATGELKDALEKVYLSKPAAWEADHPLLSESVIESKHLISGESLVVAAAPASKHAVQAFKLLSSPAAQNVVASIASDPNVWDAVLKNDALMEFLHTHKSTVEFPPDDPDTKNSVEDESPQDVFSTNSFNNSAADTNSGGEEMANGVSGLFQNMKHAVEGVKHAVEEMVSKVSCLFQHIFGPKEDDKKYTDGGKEDGAAFMGTGIGQSFLGLAMLAIMVILLKRV